MAIPLTLGALSRISEGFTDQPVEETEDTLTTVPIYGVQSQQPAGVNLQNVYGTAALPMFEFARKVQTGEVKFDVSRQFDRDAAEYFKDLPEDQIPQDLQPTIADIVGPLASGAVGMLAGEAGRLASKGVETSLGNLINPKMNLDFWTQTPQAAKNLLGLGDIKSKLNVGEVAISAVDHARLVGSENLGLQSLGNKAKQLTNEAYSINENFLKEANAKLTNNITATDVAGPGFFETGFKGYMPTGSQIALPFFADLGIGLLSGQKPKKALKSAGFSALGATVGTLVGGPIGGFIGGTLGKLFGG